MVASSDEATSPARTTHLSQMEDMFRWLSDDGANPLLGQQANRPADGELISFGELPQSLQSSQGAVSAHQLCQRCCSIDTSDLIPSRRKSHTKVFKLGMASELLCETACSMCQVISQTYRQRKFPLRNAIYYLYPFFTSQIYAYKWVYSPQLPNTEETVSFAIIDHLDLQALRQDNLWSLRDSILRIGWISPLRISSSSGDGFYAPKLDSYVDFGVIKGWLSFCTMHHQKACRPVTDPNRNMLPIKLFDCWTRSIVISTDRHDYVALSYVWGHTSEPDSTDLTNSLPNTIEDAIATTQKLGFRYLWIDRYCIDQSSTEEKAAQIQQMDLIYGNASCTIIAAAGADPSASLPGISLRPREPRSYTMTRAGCSYVSVPRDPLLDIKNSVWNSRGWTFQEALLSRRCLVFCPDQVYFTCGGMTCRDAMDIPLAAMHRKNLERFSAWNASWNDSYNDTRLDNRLFRPIVQVRYPLQECSKLLQTYTKRSMSDANDALRGILGVFQRFKAVYTPFRHFHGIIVVPDVTLAGRGEIRPSSLTEQLATGLSWDVDRSYNLYKSGKRRSGFPSWSWTGWLERLTAPTEYDGYISNTHRLRISVEDLNGGLIEWEAYCRQIGEEDELSRARPRLHVEGTFVEVSLHDLTTDPGSSEETLADQCVRWQAVLHTEDESPLFASFSLTREEDEIQQSSHERLKTLKWPGLILGLRYGTVETGHSRRFHNPVRPGMVIMILDMSSGVAERLGLAVFENNVDLGSVPIQPRSIILV